MSLLNSMRENMDILKDRLADLPSILLNRGAHDEFEEGHCAMEVVAWLRAKVTRMLLIVRVMC
jgi:hypothetical protein